MKWAFKRPAGGAQLYLPEFENPFEERGREESLFLRWKEEPPRLKEVRKFELDHYTSGVVVAGRGSRVAGGVRRPLSTFFVGLTDEAATGFLAQLPEFIFGGESPPNLTAPWLVSWHRQPTLGETMWLAHTERCVAWCWIESEVGLE